MQEWIYATGLKYENISCKHRNSTHIFFNQPNPILLDLGYSFNYLKNSFYINQSVNFRGLRKSTETFCKQLLNVTGLKTLFVICVIENYGEVIQPLNIPETKKKNNLPKDIRIVHNVISTQKGGYHRDYILQCLIFRRMKPKILAKRMRKVREVDASKGSKIILQMIQRNLYLHTNKILSVMIIS